MFIFSIIFFLVALIVLLMFLFQNMSTIAITFALWTFESPVGMLIAASVVIGFALGLVLILPSLLSKKFKLREAGRQIDLLEKRLNETAMTFESPGLGAEGESYKLDRAD